jgi:hypothetical protein
MRFLGLIMATLVAVAFAAPEVQSSPEDLALVNKRVSYCLSGLWVSFEEYKSLLGAVGILGCK